jgi:hypothetical protein
VVHVHLPSSAYPIPPLLSPAATRPALSPTGRVPALTVGDE